MVYVKGVVENSEQHSWKKIKQTVVELLVLFRKKSWGGGFAFLFVLVGEEGNKEI